MEYDFMSVMINQQYELEEWGDTVADNAYGDYPYLYRGDFVDETQYRYNYGFDFCYAYGANAAYENNPHALMNQLMAEVF